MKILELRFKNLNSLYGEWCIDFTGPEYITNGIFALTGPTGAGKSTTLDAICLALYGETPRLGKITKSANEIMSRQTGECYAEVIFESKEGRFRCHWSQHRARKHANGDLQNPQHEIPESIENGRVIEHQLRKVALAIEDKTGMDFDRFTRSILLAQGGFDTFLKANIEEKSKILEQITGTKIYTEISKRVHERQREERNRLNLLQAETSGFILLEPDEEEIIQKNLADQQKQEADLSAKTNETGKAIAWLVGIDGLNGEIESLADESGKLEIELKSFQPDREQLRQAQKAAGLDGEYANLTAVRKQQETDQNSLKTEDGKLPDLELAFQQKVEALKAVEKRIVEAKAELKTASPLIQNVRSLDQKLTLQIKTMESAEAACKEDVAKIESDQKLKLKEQNNLDTASGKLRTTEEYLSEHSRDVWLVSGLTGIESQLGNLLTRHHEIRKNENDKQEAAAALEQISEKLDTGTEQCSTRKQELAKASELLNKGKKALKTLLGDRLLREYRAEKEKLLREMALLARIVELEDHRAKLEDGKPCPLCGAGEHPYAEGNVPIPDEQEQKIVDFSDLIGKAEAQESVIKNLEIAEKEAQHSLSESEKIEGAVANEKQTAKKNLTHQTDDLKKKQSDYVKLKKGVSSKLQPLGIVEISESDISRLLTSLQERLTKWQSHNKDKAEIEKQISELESELKRLDAVIDIQTTASSEKQKMFETVKQEYTDANTERLELYGDKKPDTEEQQLNKAIDDAEVAEKQTRILQSDAQQKLNAATTNVTSLKERIEQGIPELETLESGFSASLQSVGFAVEKQFLEAQLSSEERGDLITRAKDLDDRKLELKSRRKDRKDRLATELTKKVTERSLKELEPQFEALGESLKQLREAIAELKHKLTDNTIAKERVKEKQFEIDAQQQECSRWDKLHGLIGSADGKKYRNFAQGLTFELMVSHANQQLEKMTDRYLLVRDEEEPLKLNVVDNYQAGEIRSTKNLSGGESFIVSLTLALGLSNMASRKVRVDSLFLDEGFGTLDEDNLETALETLSSLHQEGKLIGIISHVPALKERISTQISIDPISGGKSVITGPGCGRA